MPCPIWNSWHNWMRTNVVLGFPERLIENLTQEMFIDMQLFEDHTESNPFDLVPEQYREIVEKRYVLGMTSREIGQELGLPAATIRSRLHLAMKALRRKKSRLR